MHDPHLWQWVVSSLYTTMHRSIIGVLQNITVTRPDLSLRTELISQGSYSITMTSLQKISKRHYGNSRLYYGLMFRRTP